jgi:leucyl-tRNA synthetase
MLVLPGPYLADVMDFNFKDIETEVQDYWRREKVFHTEIDDAKPKYYVLDMFPYPSGAGLHVGHPLGYIASDIISRFKRIKGFNVLHPMGYDSFGLPAEQYAIQTGQHPAITTEENIKTFRSQMDKLGFSFDWRREVRTSDPKFYKWTQWIFIQLFHSWYNNKTGKAESIDLLVSQFENDGSAGIEANCSETKNFTADDWINFSTKEQSDILLNYRLAYIADSWVNWCPALGTVLANDEVKDGVSERGGYPVERKLMKQWSLRITAYAERLLKGLDDLQWSESIKETQRNWIGKSEGCLIKFEVASEGRTPLPGRGAGGEEENLTKDSNLKTSRYLTANPAMAAYLQKQAAQQKKEPTQAEKILWERLRNQKLEYKFRRQHPIDNFIADLVCLELRMIIELDGENHKENEYDIERTKILKNLGYEVIRFWNEDVIQKTNDVIRNIQAVLHRRAEILTPNPSPVEKGTETLSDGDFYIEVFTTRPDTIFGVSFITLAPEHELVTQLTTEEYKKPAEGYVEYAKNRSERDRMTDIKKVTGQFTGSYAVHPFTKQQIPIWISEYVLATYGTGAVMGVPGHDERDHRFATHFDLPFTSILKGVDVSEKSFDEKSGILCHSDFLDDLPVQEAIKRAIEEIVNQGIGTRKINYKLRDAIFGRQRYWGEPIPIYYDEEGIPHTVDENDLPVVLPEVDKYLPTENGEPPLARAQDWFYKPLYNSPEVGENPIDQSLQGPTNLSKGEAALTPIQQLKEGQGYETANRSNWKFLKKNSRENRKQSTEAESVLWEHLRNHKLGEHFRRQYVIEKLIVDFVCLKKKLIVEVGGGIHLIQVEEDNGREEELHKFGFRIIRFKNEEVLNAIDDVLNKIRITLQKQSDKIAASGEALSESKSPLRGDLEGPLSEMYPLETTTMPGWAGSNWYFLRYEDPYNEKKFASEDVINYWQNIDLYVGGDEHATGHLLYFRFCTKFLFDLGFIPFEEPAKKLVNQGMLQAATHSILVVSNTRENEIFIVEGSLAEGVSAIKFWNGKIVRLPKLAKRIYVSYEVDKFNPIPPKIGVSQLYTSYVPLGAVDSSSKSNNDLYNLHIGKFISALPGNEDSLFVTLEGCYQGAEFYPFSETSQRDCFKVKFQGFEKMSKSKYNVINPNEVVEKYGADAFRLYEMFLGPIEQSKPWDTQGIDGVYRFLKKLWRLFYDENGTWIVSNDAASTDELKVLHRTIKKVEEDMERISFNTSVSAFMICVNGLAQLYSHKKEILKSLLIILSPFAPFITEYLWLRMGNKKSIFHSAFPIYDESLLVENVFEYPVAVNGKTRLKLIFDLNLPLEQIEKKVLSAKQLQKYFDGKTPKKVIVVKGRMINVVV